MSWGTNFVVKIILSHVEPRVLLSITTLAEFLKDVAQFNLYRCLDIKERFFLNFALIWAAKFSRAPIKDGTRWWGSKLQREIGSSTMFTKLTKASGHASLYKLLYLCLWRSRLGKKDSKSNRAKILNSFCSFVYLIPEESSLSERVYWI